MHAAFRLTALPMPSGCPAAGPSGPSWPTSTTAAGAISSSPTTRPTAMPAGATSVRRENSPSPRRTDACS